MSGFSLEEGGGVQRIPPYGHGFSRPFRKESFKLFHANVIGNAARAADCQASAICTLLQTCGLTSVYGADVVRNALFYVYHHVGELAESPNAVRSFRGAVQATYSEMLEMFTSSETISGIDVKEDGDSDENEDPESMQDQIRRICPCRSAEEEGSSSAAYDELLRWALANTEVASKATLLSSYSVIRCGVGSRSSLSSALTELARDASMPHLPSSGALAQFATHFIGISSSVALFCASCELVAAASRSFYRSISSEVFINLSSKMRWAKNSLMANFMKAAKAIRTTPEEMYNAVGPTTIASWLRIQPVLDIIEQFEDDKMMSSLIPYARLLSDRFFLDTSLAKNPRECYFFACIASREKEKREQFKVQRGFELSPAWCEHIEEYCDSVREKLATPANLTV